jgi:COMPASS component SWD2
LKLPQETIKSPLAAFDYTGLVFAVTAEMNTELKGYYLHLYDARNHGAGAFAELKILQAELETAIQSHINVPLERAKELSQAEWTSIKFNVAGDRILIGTNHGMSIILDGFTGAILRIMIETRPTTRNAVSCFTPDDQTILLGNDDGTISCWSVESGMLVKTLTGHIGPVSCIAANPKYNQIASACTQTAIWHW